MPKIFIVDQEKPIEVIGSLTVRIDDLTGFADLSFPGDITREQQEVLRILEGRKFLKAEADTPKYNNIFVNGEEASFGKITREPHQAPTIRSAHESLLDPDRFSKPF